MNYLKSRQARIYIIIIIIAIVFSTIVFSYTRKSNIYNATVDEINAVSDDIGPKLSQEIYYYVHHNEITRVDDLKYRIDYLGVKRLKQLKEVYK